MFQNLKTEIDGPIGRLTLTRGEKLNPLGVGTLEEIALAARYFDEETDAKVVIVTGEGRAFSAGADLDSFSKKSDKSTREVAEIGRRMAEAIEAMEAITIAKIRGWCVGGGLVLAAACDLRFATAETRFRWASIAKPMTAVAALQLVDKSELDLTADVRELVPA